MGNRAKYSNFKNKNDGQQKNGIGNEDESTLFKLGNIKILDDESTLCTLCTLGMHTRCTLGTGTTVHL